MGFGDIFKANENKQLKDRVEELEAMLSPEQQQILNARGEIARLEQVISQKNEEIVRISNEINARSQNISRIDAEIAYKKSLLVSLDEQMMLESFGLYKPRFDFAKSEQYAVKLEEIRRAQTAMITGNTAVMGNFNWQVNGSNTQGQKMVKDMQKLLLRAFNSECDELVSKIKYNNFETSLKRINASCDAISKLGTIMQISISPAYRKAKIDELTLAFEYAQLKQKEKEDEKAARAALREEMRVQKEIEEERRRLEKEQTHYQNALEKLNAQLAQNPNDEELKTRQRTLVDKINDTEKAIADVDYREANKRVGYVYVISNVGAFGKDVYKIGMTRRSDPQERIDELGDASVPFNFDVHAMIFTDDAPGLEAALHRAFADKKVNMVNPRREFFHVTLDEIKAVVRENFDKTVEFTDIPSAEQWRVSMKMRGESPAQPAYPDAEISQSPTVQAPTNLTIPNLTQLAIEKIHEKLPGCECTYTENSGIYSIIIPNHGRLRVSNNGCVKCDYFDKDGRVYFFSDLDLIPSIFQ